MLRFFSRKAKSRSKLGFTLMELIVGVTVMGIIAAIGVTTYAGVISRAEDKAHLVSLQLYAKSAIAIYANGYGTPTWEDALAQAALEMTFAAGENLTPTTLAAADLVAAQVGASTDPNTISYSVLTSPATSPVPGAALGLASKSSTGNCTLVVASTTGIQEAWTSGRDLGSNCTGAAALMGENGASNLTFLEISDFGPPAPVGLSSTVTQPVSGTDGSISGPIFTLTPSTNTDVANIQVYRDNVLIDTIAADSITYTDTTAASGTTYTYSFNAIDNQGLTSTTSTLEVTTKPGALTGGSINYTVAQNLADATITWDAPAVNEVITGYHVFANSVLVDTILSSTTTTSVLLDQTLGVPYTYDIKPYNIAGDGLGLTTTITYTTAADAPTSISGTASTSKIDLTWTPVTSTPAKPVTGYYLYRSTASGPFLFLATLTPETTTTYQDIDIANGTSYSYEIASFGPLGAGAHSAPTTILTAYSLPSCSAAVASATNATTGSITFTCSSSAAAPTTGVNIKNSVTGVTLVTGALTSPVSVPGLTAGNSYTFDVIPYNSAGEGAAFTTNTMSTISAPTDQAVITITSTSTQLALDWTTVTSTQSKPVDSYLLQTSPNGTSSWTTLYEGTLLSYTHTSLTNGEIYFYRVAAVNAAGTGTYSEVTSSAPVAVPGTPTGLSATASDGSVTLNWNSVASTPAAPVSGYYLYSATSDTGPFVLDELVVGALASSVASSSLTNGTTYFFKIATYGTAGTGPQSVPFPALGVTPITTPSQISGLAVTGATSNTITVSWSTATSTTQAPVTAVDVLLDGVLQTSLSSNATSYQYTLTSGVSHNLTVRSKNQLYSSANTTISKTLYAATGTATYVCSGGGTYNGTGTAEGSCGTYLVSAGYQPASYVVSQGYWTDPAPYYVSSSYMYDPPAYYTDTSSNVMTDPGQPYIAPTDGYYWCPVGALNSATTCWDRDTGTYAASYTAGTSGQPYIAPTYTWVSSGYWTDPAPYPVDNSYWVDPAPYYTDTSYWVTPAYVNAVYANYPAATNGSPTYSCPSGGTLYSSSCVV